MTAAAHTGEDTAAFFDAARAADATSEQWADLEWRLDNLYWIVNKSAKIVPFTMNDEQREFIQNFWYRNLILKARQRGFSTLMQLLQLDQALFNQNHNGVTISETLPKAHELFGKIEFSYERLPTLMKDAFPIVQHERGASLTIGHDDGTGHSANSTISVKVNAMGGTVNLLHVSELGPIGMKFPARAEEIRTGTLPAVPTGIGEDGEKPGTIVVESTARGQFGLFWELCEPALKRWRDKSPETSLDWRLHFFPWYRAKEYRLPADEASIVSIPDKFSAYFRKLEAELGIKLDAGQRAWYVKTAETQKHKMKQEYPSTPEEAFEQSVEGSIYGEQMTWLREQGRLCDFGIDINYPVDTFWDFGTGKNNAIWFHQVIGIQHRWFYYVGGELEDGIKGLRYWWVDVLEAHRHRHGYAWGLHVLPHDADATILGEIETNKRAILEQLGMGRGEGGKIVVVQRVTMLSTGIDITKKHLAGNHWFARHKPDRDKGEDIGAGNGVAALDGYQYEWDGKLESWKREPLHNWASHPADAWRQYAQAEEAGLLRYGNSNSSLTKFKQRPRRGI